MLSQSSCPLPLAEMSMVHKMMDLIDVSKEIQEALCRSYNIPDDINQEDLMGGFFDLENGNQYVKSDLKHLHINSTMQPKCRLLIVLYHWL